MTDKKYKPAFPHQKEDGSAYWGMTLRDYFAAQIFPDVRQQVSKLDRTEYNIMALELKADNSKMLIALMAYEYADAMIAAREV